MRRMILLGVLGAFLATAPVGSNHARAQSATGTAAVRQYWQNHELEILREYFALLSIPNSARDQVNIRKNAQFIRDMLEKRGVSARLLETGGSPVVYGELQVPGATQTLMFYAHYDGQPADPSKWVDSKPFEPVLRPRKLLPGSDQPKPVPLSAVRPPIGEDWRIYARSASDDKAPIMAICAALDAMRAANLKPSSNLKFIFEGEEEAGSTHLKPFCEQNKDLLQADVLFICDGPVYYSGDPTLYFGVRGIVTMELTVYGPNTNLHSGHFGNWAPNPAWRLARLLSTMRDDQGRVLIEHFYDTVVPLSPAEQEALQAIPRYDEKLMREFGFARPEGGGKSLMELIQLPSLNIRGLSSGWTGKQARTIIPASATAAIDIRLVKANDPDAMVQTVIRHIEAQGYHVLNREPTQEERLRYPLLAKVIKGHGYPAARTPMDLPISQKVIRALKSLRDRNVVLMPTLGGSVPLYIFVDILHTPTIGVPIVNHDNNQHQPNENLRVGHLWQGIETLAALMMMR